MSAPEPNHTADPPDETLKDGDDEQAEAYCGDSYGSFILPAPLLKEADGEDRPAAVQTLRMDGCGLKTMVLESLGGSS